MLRINRFFNEQAHLSEEGIALYVDALRFEKVYTLPSAILSHVANCRDCKMEIMEVYSVPQVGETGRIEEHPFFSGKTSRSAREFSIAFRAAAVLVIGISAGLVFYYFTLLFEERDIARHSIVAREYIEKGKQVLVPGSGMSTRTEQSLPDNFSISINLENLINSQSRSLSTYVISPVNGESLKDTIAFRWKADINDPITLKILTNKEETVESVIVRHSPYFFTRKISPGLYYWKLESKDELLYLGKFRVK